jgi:adenosylhomocysteine nucleosidase
MQISQHAKLQSRKKTGDKELFRIVVLISANIEWSVIREIYPNAIIQFSPYGEWFILDDVVLRQASDINRNPETMSSHLNYPQMTPDQSLIFFHGGWGKIAAAASTQYVIDHWHPVLLINFGTCGGIVGEIERDTIILVTRTIVYDIIEQMGDYQEHIAYYTTELELDWLEGDYPLDVRKATLVSGDRDLLVQEIPLLISRYQAIAGDWESGAIAWVAKRNQVYCLILRGVTDLVGSDGGEAYGNITLFTNATHRIMRRLLASLPGWIALSNTIQ